MSADLHASFDLSLSDISWPEDLIASLKSMSMSFSSIIFKSPTQARRIAKVSFYPEGCWSIINVPINVSKRSAIARVMPSALLGVLSPAKRGR